MPLDALWGRLAGELLDRLDAAATWAERFDVLERVLVRALSARVEIPSGARPEATEAFRRLAAIDGRVDVADAGRRARLEPPPPHASSSRPSTASGPKEMARVLRFERSKQLLDRARPPHAGRRSPPSAATPTRPTWPGSGGRSPASSPTQWMADERLPIVQDDDARRRRIIDAMTQPTVWPCLNYRDARGAIAFLTEAFGFVEQLVVPGETDDVVVHSQLRGPRAAA